MKPKTALNETAARAQRHRPLNLRGVPFFSVCVSCLLEIRRDTRNQCYMLFSNTTYFSCLHAYEYLFVKFDVTFTLVKFCGDLFCEIMQTDSRCQN